jgi:hypothetical protein
MNLSQSMLLSFFSCLIARRSAAARSASLSVILACAPAAVAAQSLVWVHQFPGPSRGIAVDPDGNSVAANNTVGETTVRKVDPFGNVVWESLISESGDDVFIFGVATDGAGRVGVAGRIGNSGADMDVFVRIYDSGGVEQWSDTFGDVSANDEARGIAFDGNGDVYVGGQTSGTLTAVGSLGGQDGFLRKYDALGTVQWTQQLGTTENDAVFGVALDSANDALVTGRTSGDLEGALIGDSQDGFVRKYSPVGLAVWTQQFGSAGNDTEGVSVVATAGDNVLIGGRVNATEEQFVMKRDPSGALQWTASVAPVPFERDVAVAGDDDGDAYLAGMTFLGDFLGQDIAGGEVDSDDAYVQKRLAADGSLDWSVRLSSQSDDDVPSSFDKSLAIATFGSGSIYLSGETSASFGGFGSGNGFVARLASDISASDIASDISAAPDEAFKGAGHSGAILDIMADINQAIAVGDIDEATRKLLNLHRRLDGCEDGAPADANDWIVDCDVQDVIRTLVEALLASLS